MKASMITKVLGHKGAIHMKKHITRSVFILFVLLVAGQGCSAGERQAEDLESSFNAVCQIYDANKQQSFIHKNLNIGEKEVASFLLKKMNASVLRRGDTRPVDVMACILKAMPEKALQWFLDNHTGLSPTGRCNVIGGLHFLDSREAYALIFSFIDDTTEIPPARESLELATGPYYPLRVCDHVYNAFSVKMRKRKDWPSGLLWTFLPSSTPKERDTSLAGFKQWWTNAASTVLTEIPPLLPSDSTVNEKIGEFLKTRGSGDTPRE